VNCWTRALLLLGHPSSSSEISTYQLPGSNYKLSVIIRTSSIHGEEREGQLRNGFCHVSSFLKKKKKISSVLRNVFDECNRACEVLTSDITYKNDISMDHQADILHFVVTSLCFFETQQ